MSETIKKSGIISIVGRPNVGKSTLINAMVGEKIAIVTPKPQTTRNRIYGVVNRGDTQLVFMDTPGFHTPRSKLGNYMVKVVGESIGGVDAVMLIVEPISTIGNLEQELINRIKSTKVPSVLVINKIDTVPKTDVLSVIQLYSMAHEFDEIVPISAKYFDGVDHLLEVLARYASEGPPLFPEDMVTDQPEMQVCAEIIREKLLLCLEDEVPHGTAVEITKFSERDNGIVDIDATIYCEKNAHKGIIIGKKGAMLKRIGELSRHDIEEFLGTKVFLQTWVKVKENWRDNDFLVRNFGYK